MPGLHRLQRASGRAEPRPSKAEFVDLAKAPTVAKTHTPGTTTALRPDARRVRTGRRATKYAPAATDYHPTRVRPFPAPLWPTVLSVGKEWADGRSPRYGVPRLCAGGDLVKARREAGVITLEAGRQVLGRGQEVRRSNVHRNPIVRRLVSAWLGAVCG